MGPQIVHLPDGQNFTVTPVFAGLFFKSHELSTHHTAFPIGWTIVINTQDAVEPQPSFSDSFAAGTGGAATSASSPASSAAALPRDRDDDDEADDDEDRDGRASHLSLPSRPRSVIHGFTRPTLQSDSLFISSVSNPSSSDFKPPASPTRQVAMMLWVTLYWYFHQPAPDTQLAPSRSSRQTPSDGRPRGDWRVRVRRDGVLRGRNLIPKLERMGLIASMDSSVGSSLGGTPAREAEGWEDMFVTRRMFWQISGRLFLFTLQPKRALNPAGATDGSSRSPAVSRPSSPGVADNDRDVPGSPMPGALASAPSFPIGPFFSSSHLPTYYPPAPLTYVMTDGIRHPLRPKPPRMGEVFYTRFIPSVKQYLAFRVASLSPSPVPYLGPASPSAQGQGQHHHHHHLTGMSDSALLERWMRSSRVSAFWGDYSADMLRKAMSSRFSFPVVGLWDGVPFGYFEVYWVKEDALGRHLGGEGVGDWDRGLHMLVGEEWARGRVMAWLSSLAHWCWTADYRTMSICAEPRVDNARFIQHLQYAGFARERDIAFPHKQAAFMRLRRDNWEAPAL